MLLRVNGVPFELKRFNRIKNFTRKINGNMIFPIEAPQCFVTDDPESFFINQYLYFQLKEVSEYSLLCGKALYS